MALILTADERTELERRLRSRKIRAEDARRAQVVATLLELRARKGAAPWSEALVDVPPIDDGRAWMAIALQSDVAMYAAALASLVSLFLLARVVWTFATAEQRWLSATEPAPIDARHGVVTQTRRHSFIVSLLGIRHVIVAVNKMDLVGWSQETFERIRGGLPGEYEHWTEERLYGADVETLIGEGVDPHLYKPTRNDVAPSPSQATGVNRSGFFISALALAQSSRWIVMPLPSEM